MNPPGQMLIEMLCEDQGFFLEIVDIIRGFGLNILKAKMDLRKNKLWARFIVEANRHVTRIDVFWSLINLLQQPNAAGIDSSNNHGNIIPSNIA
ncbi:transcription factor LHW-like [Trifolium medium]|uniref:Transcription factor LHW-like n=1 Tax=Trifolium medium TaxID=97028 RepID=A0A392QUQ4_9FABA|nr:transcription factor LHW-like [Trifolium medium]